MPTSPPDPVLEPREYRGWPHTLVVVVAFLAISGFTLVASALASSIGGRIVGAFFSAVLLLGTLHVLGSKAIADADGVVLRLPPWTVRIPWNDIDEVVAANVTSGDPWFLTRRAPVLIRASGRRVKLFMVSSYCWSSSTTDTKADKVAAELESLRVRCTR